MTSGILALLRPRRRAVGGRQLCVDQDMAMGQAAAGIRDRRRFRLTVWNSCISSHERSVGARECIATIMLQSFGHSFALHGLVDFEWRYCGGSRGAEIAKDFQKAIRRRLG